MVALLCLPFARTLEPAAVIGDPALVIVLLAALLAASTWTMRRGRTHVEARDSTGPSGVGDPKRHRAGLSRPTAAGLGDDIDAGTTVVGPAPTGEVSPDQAGDRTSVGPRWYSVRCHFRFDETFYEERITAWQAADFDEAISFWPRPKPTGTPSRSRASTSNHVIAIA